MCSQYSFQPQFLIQDVIEGSYIPSWPKGERGSAFELILICHSRSNSAISRTILCEGELPVIVSGVIHCTNFQLR